jgi:hypothetical protein
MDRKFRLAGLAGLLAFVVLASGCISIEQEIYLQPDGSGELLLHIGLPEFPEEMKQNAPLGAAGPEATLQKFKDEVTRNLPPTVKLKEAREVKRNGTQGFYAVFHFQQFKDVETLMAQVMKESATDAQTGAKKPSEWSMQIEKAGNLTHFTQRFFADLSESNASAAAEVKLKTPEAADKPAPRKSRRSTQRRAAARKPVAPPASPDPFAAMGADLSKQLEPLLYGIVKFRFVLHTPTPITASNADIVLNGKTALWNASLAAFVKEKKPIEMKASY